MNVSPCGHRYWTALRRKMPVDDVYRQSRVAHPGSHGVSHHDDLRGAHHAFLLNIEKTHTTGQKPCIRNQDRLEMGIP